MFWSEIRSGFKEPGGTPPPRIPRSTPPPQGICIFRFEIWLKIENQMLVNTDTET